MTKTVHALFLILLVSVSVAKAQKKPQQKKFIKEGIVTYSATYDIPADQPQDYNNLPSEITIYFRGDSSAAILSQDGSIIKGISVFKSNYRSMIVEIPSQSKKIFVELSPAEVDSEKMGAPTFTVKKDKETDEINGYKCTKTIITDVKTGESYDLWLTNDVDMEPNSVSRLVSNFGGVPIRFVTFNKGIKISAELEEIEELRVPKGFFSPTSEYEKMTYEDLKKITAALKQ